MLVPVILSGGAGTRLWPLSRESHPKPFLKLPDGKSLLQSTFHRACSLQSVREIITITNKEYYLKSKPEYECAPDGLKLPPHTFLLEPMGKNTACAIALAVLKAKASHGDDAILLVMPADHLIDDTEMFSRVCQTATYLAKQNKIVTFGITPTGPETGFGYIECGDKIENSTAYYAKRFIEKPSLNKAKDYVQSQRYFWNAGIFCFKVQAIEAEYLKHAPGIYEVAKKCWEKSQSAGKDDSAFHFDANIFAEFEDISIDYALLEKINNIAVVPCEFPWDDIGTWASFQKLHDPDDNGNAVLGEAILIDSHNNFIHGNNRMIASIGLKDTIIIDTPDALLISHQDRAQDVRHIVKKLKEESHESYLSHVTVERPWGSYTVLDNSKMFKVKRIEVKPNASLSLQSHQHRSEHWVVVEGVARVVNGNEERLLYTNEAIYIPKQELHRISNASDELLVIIEVQVGSYLGEDDIKRYDDIYGRA